MPTIDKLTPVTAVADSDLVMLQRGTATHKATRAQLLAGTQSQIGLSQGQLLGRVTAGAGAPEAVQLGANLVMQAGSLSATTTWFPRCLR